MIIAVNKVELRSLLHLRSNSLHFQVQLHLHQLCSFLRAPVDVLPALFLATNNTFIY